MEYYDLINKRSKLLGTNVPTFYDEPVQIVKGKGVWLWDQTGKKYLDCYNNVPHVGHCHPKIVESIYKQSLTLNTHTRYLHEGILNYLDRLLKTFSSSLNTAIMTCTGSEANDIALRMLEISTGKKGIICTDHTYHGNTYYVSQLSNSNPPPGNLEKNFKFVETPDSYREKESLGIDSNSFAEKVEKLILNLNKSKYGFAGIIICPFFANEGFPDLPDECLIKLENIVRKYNGLIIADEVQPGFGRLGSHMWAHQKMKINPDIVTLGKPMANGYPVGAVVSSSEILNQFRKQYRYFNTFGGNPVACAASMAVLDVLEEEKLIQNAYAVGEYAKKGLKKLSSKYDFIRDVRGRGLFFGAELVINKKTKKPATEFAKRIVNQMKNHGILLNRLGKHYNTLKIRPPMPFSKSNADFLINTLDIVFSENQKYL